MTVNYYLLWAAGNDRPGIVAAVAKTLFEIKCNLEDSSMMRLGSEFGIFLIFTSKKVLSTGQTKIIFNELYQQVGLKVGIKQISKAEAQFKKPQDNSTMLRVHGHDQPGIVFQVTQFLSKQGFNITDLATHRTNQRKNPGYMLFIEGEFLRRQQWDRLKIKLKQLERKLGCTCEIDSVNARPF